MGGEHSRNVVFHQIQHPSSSALIYLYEIPIIMLDGKYNYEEA